MSIERTGQRRLLRYAFVTAWLVTAGACGPMRTGSSDDRAMLVFVNETMDQASVYATIGSSTTVRLGTVLGSRTDTLIIPSSVAAQGGTTRFIARLLARSRSVQTGAVVINPGDWLHVRLPPDARMLIVAQAR